MNCGIFKSKLRNMKYAEHLPVTPLGFFRYLRHSCDGTWSFNRDFEQERLHIYEFCCKTPISKSYYILLTLNCRLLDSYRLTKLGSLPRPEMFVSDWSNRRSGHLYLEITHELSHHIDKVAKQWYFGMEKFHCQPSSYRHRFERQPASNWAPEPTSSLPTDQSMMERCDELPWSPPYRPLINQCARKRASDPSNIAA